MSLTDTEELKIAELEETAKILAKLTKGAASKNQLNRLLVLTQETIARLTKRVEELERQMDKLLTLARKLQ